MKTQIAALPGSPTSTHKNRMCRGGGTAKLKVKSKLKMKLMEQVMIKDRSKTKKTNETGAFRRLARAISANKSTLAGLALLLGGGLTALAEGNDNRAPEVPNEIAVEAGNKVHFHGFGVGVQIYTWNGSTWGPAVPEATLFDGNGVVAIHFGGPACGSNGALCPEWQSNSGSQVVGAFPPTAVTVDTNAIPWVRLSAKSTQGPGIFADTSFIQRVNTVGGKAPSENGTFVGQVARVPYAADYFFYRRTNN